MKRFFRINLISAFLLLFTIQPLSTYAEEGLVYWVNPDGGIYYHLDQNCRAVHPKYLPLPVSMTKEELESSFYLPWSICVDESHIASVPEEIKETGTPAEEPAREMMLCCITRKPEDIRCMDVLSPIPGKYTQYSGWNWTTG